MTTTQDNDHHGDDGYFGPASVTWRLHGESVAMVGGLRALLMQALHPDAMAKLVSVSTLAHDPWRRLQRTIDYVTTVSFASRHDADAAAAHVRAVHRAVGVDDPEQLAWVHAALVDSMLAVATAAGLRLGPADRDRYVDEQAVAAGLVGVPADRTPRSVAELGAIMAAIRPRLRATREARQAARLVMAMPLPARWPLAPVARTAWTGMSLAAVGLLPRWARRMYRIPSPPGSDAATMIGLHALRVASALVPETRRHPLVRAAHARLRRAPAV